MFLGAIVEGANKMSLSVLIVQCDDVQLEPEYLLMLQQTAQSYLKRPPKYGALPFGALSGQVMVRGIVTRLRQGVWAGTSGTFFEASFKLFPQNTRRDVEFFIPDAAAEVDVRGGRILFVKAAPAPSSKPYGPPGIQTGKLTGSRFIHEGNPDVRH